MTRLDPAVRKETTYIAVWVCALSLVMEGVFLILGKWDVSVLIGNLAGAAAAILNFFLLARSVSKAVQADRPEDAATRVKASRSVRLLGMMLVCVLFIWLVHTNVYATLIPLLFPRIGIAFRPAIDRKMGVSTRSEGSAAEGSDLD